MFFKKNKKENLVRQSDKHKLIKPFLIEKEIIKKQTQFSKRISGNFIKTVIIDSIAYWIKDNIFYMSETINNIPNIKNARPVDIENMPKRELDKMLLILDNLKKEDSDDSGSSRN